MTLWESQGAERLPKQHQAEQARWAREKQQTKQKGRGAEADPESGQ